MSSNPTKGGSRSVPAVSPRAFVPTKGGDGGLPPQSIGSNWSRNGEDVLCGKSMRGTPSWGEYEASLVETADPTDRAHTVHRRETDSRGRLITSGGETLVPPSELQAVCGHRPGRQRRYPPSQMVGPEGHRVSVDSMFDRAAAAAWRLEGQGIPLGWGRAARRSNTVPIRIELFASMLDRDEAREIAQPRTFVRLSKREAESERETQAWLDAHDR